MNIHDLRRLAENEKRVMESQSINRISELTGFPFGCLDDLREAKASGHISFGAHYNADLMWSMGTRGDVIAHCFWMGCTLLCCVAFVAAAFITDHFTFLIGLLATSVGFLGSSPVLKPLVSPIVALAWIPCIYFGFTNPLWAWVIGGFYGGYIFTSTARQQLTMVLEERALASEVFFCYLYLNRMLVVKDNRLNRIL